MKTPTLFLCLACLLFGGLTERAQAVVSVSFTGYITEANAAAVARGIDVGDPFSGGLLYDFGPSNPASFAGGLTGEGFIAFHSPGAGLELLFFDPFGVGAAGDFLTHIGQINVSLNNAGQVSGGSIDMETNIQRPENWGNFRGVINSVPDPASSLALLALGLAGVAGFSVLSFQRKHRLLAPRQRSQS